MEEEAESSDEQYSSFEDTLLEQEMDEEAHEKLLLMDEKCFAVQRALTATGKREIKMQRRQSKLSEESADMYDSSEEESDDDYDQGVGIPMLQRQRAKIYKAFDCGYAFG